MARRGLFGLSLRLWAFLILGAGVLVSRLLALQVGSFVIPVLGSHALGLVAFAADVPGGQS